MSAGPEILAFPGLDETQAVRLTEALEGAAEAARVFAAAVTGQEVFVEFTVDPEARIHWMRRRDGSLSVHLPVDVGSPPDLVPPPTPAAYRRAFRSGFLHRLGRLLNSPSPDHPDALDTILRDPRPVGLPLEVRELLRKPAGPRFVRALQEQLEAHRTDGLVRRALPHASEYLEPRDAAARRSARSADPIEALLAACGLVLRGRADPGELELLGPDLNRDLRETVAREGPEGANRLAETVLKSLLPRMLQLGDPATAPETDHRDVTDHLAEPERLRGLEDRREMDTERVHEPVQGEVVRLPHANGGDVLIRVHRAQAEEVPPSAPTRHVLDLLADPYGPRAREAFADEASALRRALRVNWDRRYRGRYRSGKRVGIPNLRRYLTLDDPRIFQRLEVPQGMSYYFHLLVDASYSMLEHDNASKALAVAGAFTGVLTSARIPVDVTLYSTALTVLHDHRETFTADFGGDFGYLIAGTMEVEAIAWAKQRADEVVADHKLIVVLTDGTPVTSTLPHLGADSLAAYYNSTLEPWLRRRGIELLALGLGVCPEYHSSAVCLEEGWGSLGVFTDLLESVVHEGQERARELWR